MPGKMPDYKISAFANLDLAEHMKNVPMEIDEPGDIEWDISETDYHYVAKGDIKIPVEMYFSKPEGDEQLEVRRVIVLGKRRFDARLDEIGEEQPTEKQTKYGVDSVQVQSDNFSSYRKNMGMK